MKHLCLIAMGMLWTGCLAGAEEQQRPNILFILSDDHAVRTIGAYGDPIARTPSLDRLAKEGALFRNAFVTNSICCPARASILTGKFSHLNGVVGNGSKWNTGQWTYSKVLGEAGYQTGLIGKWHLIGDPEKEYQYWNILNDATGQGYYYNTSFRSASGVEPTQGYETDVVTDKSIEWLNKRDRRKPFLLSVQFKDPHVARIPAERFMSLREEEILPEPATLFDTFRDRLPFVGKAWMKIESQEEALNIYPTKEEIAANPSKMPPLLARMTPQQREAFHHAYDPRNLEYRKLKEQGLMKGQVKTKYAYQRFMKDYLRCVAAIDDNVGRLLEYLDKNGLTENTIVIYASDQGYYTGEHGWAEKRWMYEESLRFPLMIRWPGRIKPHTEIREMVQNIDLAPTLAQAGGAAVPATVQGCSLLPLVMGQQVTDWRKEMLYTYYDHGHHNVPRHLGVRDESHKLIYYPTTRDWEYFDLSSDPHELKNRAADPSCEADVARLKVRLTALENQYALINSGPGKRLLDPPADAPSKPAPKKIIDTE